MSGKLGYVVTALAIWGSLAQIAPKVFGTEMDRSTALGSAISALLHPAIPWIAGTIVLVWIIAVLAKILTRLQNTSVRPVQGVDSDIEFLGPLPIGDWWLFRIDRRLKVVDDEGYIYYEKQPPEGKAKIHDRLRWEQSKFYRRDLIAATDERLALKLELDELVKEGNELCRHLGMPGLPIPSLLTARPGNTDVSQWEAKVGASLHMNLPDCEGEFLRDVGPEPHGIDPLVHRVQTRIERLVRIKDRI